MRPPQSRSCSCSPAARLSIYPLSALFRWSRWRLTSSFQHTLFWGGLRGALGLALALAVPPNGARAKTRSSLTAFVVVAFSILVQGLTMPWLIKRLNLGRAAETEAVAAPADCRLVRGG